jgi:ABC-type sugar transport system ATPase subunit
MSRRPLLEFAGVSKRFGNVSVLKNVSWTVGEAQTVGLVGENGAGKSTLMNILGGNLRPDAGRMRWRDEEFHPTGPASAARVGIAFVHQELNLFPNLTIAENLFLTSFPTRGPVGWIDRRAAEAKATVLLKQVGLECSPSLTVECLSAGERQLVEIAKALGAKPRLMILDEPTTSLSTRESSRLFRLLQQLRREGMALIYISHALGDVLNLCEAIVVLRDGEMVGQGPRESFTLEELITLMVGRSLNQVFPERRPRRGTRVLFSARGLSQPGVVRDVSFDLREGEILGLFGLMGAGRSELARILFGLDPCAAGSIRLGDAVLPRRKQRHRILRGLAFVTEDRRQEGLCLQASIADNLALVALRRYAHPLGWLRISHLRAALSSLRRAVRLTASALDAQPVATLSGGNQQKVVLAKWLLAEPRVFILDEPTRGIDVGSKQEVYHLIQTMADQGAGVLLISSEIEELLGMCDRMLVMSHGEIRQETERAQFDRARILRAALRDSGVDMQT